MKWKYTIDISLQHKLYQQGKLTLEELKKQVSKIFLDAANVLDKERWIALVDFSRSFLLVEDIDEYDDVLEQVYDWADTNRVWINTLPSLSEKV
jgi:hypothetical protein